MNFHSVLPFMKRDFLEGRGAVKRKGDFDVVRTVVGSVPQGAESGAGGVGNAPMCVDPHNFWRIPFEKSV
ncbi:hypothetical protein Pan241w_13250 [Gimesia alba]|uniref:Uncharacterized protein n=1 Tax=Gimesia alba TaxID=2527973 RepID=A0A517RBM3_9PLAN|nr:hypothetical protein [Gimesia alba]QDT41265.1 hypothetical protein Pan241w_13250 [Gimesia alba]